MAISVNWVTGEIFVPRADMVLVQVSPEYRRLNVNQFRLILRDLEDDVDGRPWPQTHLHETQSFLSGVLYARKVEIIPPYFVTFEDGQYAVLFEAANNNILDRATVNQVSLRPNNSAGLQIVGVTAEEIATAVWSAQTSLYSVVGSFGEKVSKKLLTLANYLGLQ